jgi:LPXTG-site transpeptidase (sortase) family protein
MKLLILLLILVYKLLFPAAEDYFEASNFLGTEPILMISSLNIHSPITTFYLDGTSWAIDSWEQQVGHLEGTAGFHYSGNVVLAGHSEYPNGNQGVFFTLDTIKIGDIIFVREGIRMLRYEVIEVKSVDYQDLSVLYPTGENRLTLITCSIPSYVAEQGLYFERLVVVAKEIAD